MVGKCDEKTGNIDRRNGIGGVAIHEPGALCPKYDGRALMQVVRTQGKTVTCRIKSNEQSKMQ